MSLEESREPTLADLKRICRALNEAGARYLVIGGWAVRFWGLERRTGDIDLLIPRDPENAKAVTSALAAILADGAAREVTPEDVTTYPVIRVFDEVVVDLMMEACGVTHETAVAVAADAGDFTIPVADLDTLVRMKLTVRPKDVQDRAFLERRKALGEPEPPTRSGPGM